MQAEVVFTRAGSVAEVIDRVLQGATTSVDAALYRLNNPRLAQALESAAERGVHVRMVLDRGKYAETKAARKLLASSNLSFRLSDGRQGEGSKMHHKFIVVDGLTVLTGSYNWTSESEDENYDNLLILRGAPITEEYAREFESLWAGAESEEKS